MSEGVRDTRPLNGYIGRTIGKFRLEHRLGSGAMGDVFLGVHIALGSRVAVKILNAASRSHPEGIERFINEARAVAAIGHENIAAVIDQDVLDDGSPYIVMEFVEGVTLRDLLANQGPLPLRLSVLLAIDVLAAVGAAHAKGIVHRDLKPENIRVTPNERAKVLDFGVAKLLNAHSPGLTTDGAVVGTPHYMAPEQAAAKSLDGRADLYAVGVMLYECGTGQRPFQGDTAHEVLQQHLNAAPPWPHLLRAEIPAKLEEIILKALEKEPARRFESAQKMAEALRAVLPLLESGDAAAASQEVTGAAPPEYTPTGLAHGADTSPEGAGTKPPGSRTLSVVIAMMVLGVALTCGGIFVALEMRAGPVAVVPMPRAMKPVAAPAVTKIAEPAASDPEGVKTPVKKKLPKPSDGVAVASRDPAGPAPTEQLPRIRTYPVDFDPKHFELLGYLNRARALAAERMSDAVLINLDVEGVSADGTADLTLKPSFEANYWFRSPSRSVTNPAMPARDQDIECKTYIVVTATGVESRAVTSSDRCTEKPLPEWGCTMQQAMQRGAAEGARAEQVAKVSYLNDGTWMVDRGDGPNQTAYFSCP